MTNRFHISIYSHQHKLNSFKTITRITFKPNFLVTLFVASDDVGETKTKGPGGQIRTPVTCSIKKDNKGLKLNQRYFHPHFIILTPQNHQIFFLKRVNKCTQSSRITMIAITVTSATLQSPVNKTTTMTEMTFQN